MKEKAADFSRTWLCIQQIIVKWLRMEELLYNSKPFFHGKPQSELDSI